MKKQYDVREERAKKAEWLRQTCVIQASRVWECVNWSQRSFKTDVEERRRWDGRRKRKANTVSAPNPVWIIMGSNAFPFVYCRVWCRHGVKNEFCSPTMGFQTWVSIWMTGDKHKRKLPRQSQKSFIDPSANLLRQSPGWWLHQHANKHFIGISRHGRLQIDSNSHQPHERMNCWPKGSELITLTPLTVKFALNIHQNCTHILFTMSWIWNVSYPLKMYTFSPLFSLTIMSCFFSMPKLCLV